MQVKLKTPNKKFEHLGIKVEFIGQVGACAPLPLRVSPRTELFYERGNSHEFMSLVKELAPPGELLNSTNFDFEFQNVEKTYETYSGLNARLRCVSARDDSGSRQQVLCAGDGDPAHLGPGQGARHCRADAVVVPRHQQEAGLSIAGCA